MNPADGAIAFDDRTLPARPSSRPGPLLPALSLAKRELVRFLRQRHRVIGALLTPIVFWLLIGGGMGSSFARDARTTSASSSPAPS